MNEENRASLGRRIIASSLYQSNTGTEAEAKSKVYLGDFKPYEFEGSSNAAATVEAPVIQAEEDDGLPF